MSDQAQATGATANTATTSAAQATEQEQTERSAGQENLQTMVSGAQENLQDAAHQQTGAGQAGGEAGETGERTEPLTEEEQQRLVEQVQAALGSYRAYMGAATAGLDRVLEAVADIASILQWQPGQYGDIDGHLGKASQGLAVFRANLVSASSLGVEPYLNLPDADLAGWLVAAVNSLKEYRRRIDGKIALMETDVGNTTAILAIERTIHEQRLISGLAGAAVGRLLAQGGLAR